MTSARKRVLGVGFFPLYLTRGIRRDCVSKRVIINGEK